MKEDLFTWPQVEDDRNIHGPLSFCTPSAVAGYATLKETFGTGMPVAELLAPAIALARRGLPQDWYTTLKVASSASVLRLYEESTRIYLPNGLPPVPPYQGIPGFLRLGKLDVTLEHLAQAGLRDFYDGEVAAQITSDIANLGGVLDGEDLAQCRAVVRDAVPIDWRGDHIVHTAGGLTAAPTLAQVIAGMAEVDLAKDGPDASWYLCEQAKGTWGCRHRDGARGYLHHSPDGGRRQGQSGLGDNDFVVLDGKPCGATFDGHIDEQWYYVVRSTSRQC
jgi:gamma-glutamyltranspeptidase/glutathione hydrolase